MKDATRRALMAALRRLEAGTAKRTDGRMTVSNLAQEAGVGRASVYRCPDVLSAWEGATRPHAPLPERTGDAALDEAQAGAPAIRSSEAQLRDAVKKLASRIYLMDRALAERDSELRRLRARVLELEGVVPLPSRRG